MLVEIEKSICTRLTDAFNATDFVTRVFTAPQENLAALNDEDLNNPAVFIELDKLASTADLKIVSTQLIATWKITIVSPKDLLLKALDIILLAMQGYIQPEPPHVKFTLVDANRVQFEGEFRYQIIEVRVDSFLERTYERNQLEDTFPLVFKEVEPK